jgi:hypothetical protein
VWRGKTCANWIGNVRHHYQNGAGLFGNSAVGSSNGRRRQLRRPKRFFKNPIDIHDTAAAKDAKQSAII